MDRRDGGDIRNTRRFKRKRKKSFLPKERIEGKMRRLARGTYMEEDMFRYFIRVVEVKISDFKNPEDKDLFITNVFKHITGKEVFFSCNQLGSRAIEMFLPHASKEILLRFTDTFSQDLRKICCDEFGSYVLQQLIAVVSTALQEVPSNEEEEQDCSSEERTMNQFKTWLLQVSQFMINNLEEFVWVTFPNHILRTVLRCLTGLPAKQSSEEEKLGVFESHQSPIEKGPALVEKCAKRVLRMPQIIDFVHAQLGSLFLQTLILSVDRVNSELSREFVHHLLDLVYDPKPMDVSSDDNISKYCTDINSLSGGNEDEEASKKRKVEVLLTSALTTHLMDVMIQVAEAKTFTEIYARCFMKRLKLLSLAPEANFCVQHLIKHCKEKAEFELIYDELSPNFEELLESNKHGIILRIGQACQRLGCKQGQFVKELEKTMHCTAVDRQNLFVLLLVHFVNFETWKCAEESHRNLKVSPVGSRLVQVLLNFPKTTKVVMAILTMPQDHLKVLLCHPHGSYIADAFFSSQTVREKSRQKFCLKLKGSYVALASSKSGSRALDAMWTWAPLQLKKEILEELAPSESLLTAFQWGNIFVDKSGLSLFKRRPDDWEQSMTREARTKKLFADIISS